MGTANGGLNKGIFDVPPEALVKELFAVGIEDALIVRPGEDLNAHQVWPFVASSLAAQGTPGPAWFLIRRCGDLGQLKAILRRAAKLGPGYLNKNLRFVEKGLNALAEGAPVARDANVRSLLGLRDSANALRLKLPDRVRSSADTHRRLPPDLEALVLALALSEAPVGGVLLKLAASETNLDKPSALYWMRMLSSIAVSVEDLPALRAVLFEDRSMTPARKALWLIDFLRWGPPVRQRRS